MDKLLFSRSLMSSSHYCFSKLVYMKHNFTPEHLLLYIYKETTSVESLNIEQALNCDDELYLNYLDLVDARQQLPRVLFNPSSQALGRIMRYSAESTVEA